jgi:hypothetical protein
MAKCVQPNSARVHRACSNDNIDGKVFMCGQCNGNKVQGIKAVMLGRRLLVKRLRRS